jgi:hypothetical protein
MIKKPLLNKAKSPVLLLIFNRPQPTKMVLEEIKKYKPTNLFIAADGPRIGNKNDSHLCRETRKVILENINWECEIKTLFRTENLGCGKAVSSAISWFFDNVNEGIILEDDCIPNTDFFYFCENLLKKYKNDTRIFHINGCNFQTKQPLNDYSYCFYQYPHIWGWATWKRAWKYYDFDLKSFSEFTKQNIIADLYSEQKWKNHWNYMFESMHKHRYDTWDFQWVYTIQTQNGLSISPKKNLVKNIGGVNKKPNPREPESMDTQKMQHPPFCVNSTRKNFWSMKILFKIKAHYNPFEKALYASRCFVKNNFPRFFSFLKYLKNFPLIKKAQNDL